MSCTSYSKLYSLLLQELSCKIHYWIMSHSTHWSLRCKLYRRPHNRLLHPHPSHRCRTVMTWARMPRSSEKEGPTKVSQMYLLLSTSCSFEPGLHSTEEQSPCGDYSYGTLSDTHMGFVFLDLSGDTPYRQIDPLRFDIFWSCSN